MSDVPRRLPRTQGQRLRNVVTTRASHSMQGQTSAARPVMRNVVGTTLVEPPPWTQTYAYPGELTIAPGTSRVTNETTRTLVLQAVHVSVATASSGASIVVVIRINGTSVLNVEIAPGANASDADVPLRTLFSPGDYITVDIAQVGTSEAGADLTVQIRAV